MRLQCGMQVSTGRLVIPMYAGAPSGATTCYSDDHGKSVSSKQVLRAVLAVLTSLPEVKSQPSRVPQWHYSTKLLGGVLATEGEITELFPPTSDGASGEGTAEPTLYYTIRNDKPHLPRQFATSTDLGS